MPCTLWTYPSTWVVCDLRSWCLTAGVLFVTSDVVLAKIPRWGEVSILISVEAGTCSEMMAFRSCSSTCFQGRSIESSVSDGGRTGQTCTRIAQMLQTTSSHHDKVKQIAFQCHQLVTWINSPHHFSMSCFGGLECVREPLSQQKIEQVDPNFKDLRFNQRHKP